MLLKPGKLVSKTQKNPLPTVMAKCGEATFWPTSCMVKIGVESAVMCVFYLHAFYHTNLIV